MFQKILAWIKELLNKMIGQNSIKEKLNVDVAISTKMAENLQLWSLMYENRAPWLMDNIKSLNLPAAITSEIARSVTIEMGVEITGSARAEYLSKQFEKVLPKLREQVEKGAAKGGLIFKPYVNGDQIVVDYVQADMFYPVSFDANGNIIACIFADQRTIGNKFYTRLEYHSMTDNGCSIRNMAFKSSTKDVLGNEVSLTSVEAWAGLQPEAIITGIEKPLFAYFRYPMANNVDPTSPLGVSCYSRAVNLIRDADVQWSNLLWEFESGQRAMYVDEIAFKKDKDGNSILPNKRLYRELDTVGSSIGEGKLFETWSPTFREVNLLNGLDAILKRIEYTCGLAYGTLSDPQNIDKTATEIKTSKQRTFATITDTQKALQNALEELLYAMDIYATLYRLAPAGAYSIAFDFDDSVIVDKDVQFQQDLRLVSSQIMSKIEFRIRNFGEDEKTAKAKIAEIQAEQPTDLFQTQEV
jgi:A118 family predicted phage portal protein